MRFRGGCKHVFAGIVRCGVCSARLTVNTGGAAPMLYCAQCDQAKRVGVAGRKSFYASTNGLREGLLFVLRDVFNPEHTETFKERLRVKLVGGSELLMQEKRNGLGKLARTMERLGKLLKELDGDDDIIQKQYRETKQEKKDLEIELAQMEAGARHADKESVEKQLAANPLDFLPRLFDTAQYIDQARKVLEKLFPRIELIDKPARNITLYRICVAPGVLVAELTKTAIVDTEESVINIKVTSGAKRPAAWNIELV